MIQRIPRTLADHQQRYPAALRTVFDTEAIQYSGAKRPGECCENVFDFADGLRLIISRDKMPDGEILVHVSASAQHGSEMYKSIKSGEMTPSMFCSEIARRHALISCKQSGLELMGFSDGKGVPHFRVVEPMDLQSLEATK